jgi:peptidoglycan hydrolase-like protein with peptidoglycan-binding domain
LTILDLLPAPARRAPEGLRLPTRRSSIAAVLLVAAVVLASGGSVGAYGRAVFPAQSLGARGIDVTALQHLLRAEGHIVVADGVFRSSTQSAVAAFQRQNGLSPTGVANTETWQALAPSLAAGSSGEAVIALQKLLNRKRGAGLALNGSFDTATRDAVRAFQRQAGLSVTGDVDGNAWRNLLWQFARPAFDLPGLCNYNGGNAGADWGTGSAVGMLEAAAALFNQRVGSHLAVGDMSWEHGGGITMHATHEVGLDADIALVRKDRRQCNSPGIGYTSSQYDREATRVLIRAIHETAPHQVKLIYFNDPVLIAEGLVQRYPRHDDHIHVRYCEVGHAQALYRCAAPPLDAGSSEAPNRTPSDSSEPTTDPTGPIRIAGGVAVRV